MKLVSKYIWNEDVQEYECQYAISDLTFNEPYAPYIPPVLDFIEEPIDEN
jgi:hypothetical protein